jgi:hypothetical protein
MNGCSRVGLGYPRGCFYKMSYSAISCRQTSLFSLTIVLCTVITLSGCMGVVGSEFSLTPTPASLLFGHVKMGSSNRQSLLLKNTGNTSIAISGISVSGTGFDVAGPTMPLTLLPGQSASWTSSFTPRAPGSASGTISVMGSASTPLAVIQASGTADAIGLSITSEPTNQSVTAGQMAAFSVAASGAAPITYQWSRNGAPISGATSASYSTSATTSADNGAQFYVVVSNPAGIVTSRTAVLTVTPAPVAPSITSEPANQSVTAGQAATFSVAAWGTAPITYQWSRNGAPISGATSASYSTSATTSADNGAQFYVVVSNPAGIVTSRTAVLTVTPAPVAPSITSEPANQSVTAGQTATFSVTATGTAPLSYQWLKSGQPIAGANSSAYTTPPTASSDTGLQFSVMVSNSAGRVTSNTASVTVNALSGQLTSSTSTLTFTNVNVNSSSSQSATLTNTGNSTVTISKITVSGAGFSVSGFSAGLALSSGQTASANVMFAPPAAGSVTGSVVVTSNAANSPTTITLSGTGIQPSGQLTPPPQAAGYNLAFADDFSTLNISPNMLGNYTWYQGLWWQQTVAPPSQFTVSNSILTLNWQNGLGDASLVTTAKDASHYQAWRYGYFEARMAWGNTTMGAWPAFWLIPVEDITGGDVVNGVRDSGEIDIMEGQGGSYPNTVYGTVHEWKNNSDVYNNNSSNAYNAPSGVDLSRYHTYGVLWTPGTISWYFDNQLIHSANTTAIFDQQTFYIVLGSQEGVNWGGGNLTGVTANTIPLNVDWVHVWQKP